MTRMEKYKKLRMAENYVNPLQRQLDAVDDEIAELNDCIQELYERVEELENKYNSDCECDCEADHRKQRGGTAPNISCMIYDVLDCDEISELLRGFYE